jgi:hypothetical protein
MMTFLNPILALAGLACIAVPILVHLLMRRRRRPILWAAMRFVLEAVRKQRRRLRLEQLLLLAARCILVALIALAIGRPIIGRASTLAGRAAVTVYLLVDDGLTSSARDADASTTALERHKAAATDLLKQLDQTAGDRVGLISLAGPARAVVVPASADVAAVGEILKDLAPTDSPADLPGAVAILSAAIEAAPAAGRTMIVVLSDFLTGSADISRKLGEFSRAGSELTILATEPAPRGVDNVTLTAVTPLRPVLIAGPDTSTRTSTRVSLRRSGPGVGTAALSSVRLRLQAPGDPSPLSQAQQTIRWTPGQTSTEVAADLELPPRRSGTLTLTASLDEDPVPGDNTWRRTLEVRQTLRLGLVAPRRLGGGSRPGVQQFEPADWIRVALDPAAGERPVAARTAREIELVEIDPPSIDPARLSDLDGLILVRPDAVTEAGWRHVRTLADVGGLIVITPPANVTVHLWTDAMTRALGLDWTLAREAITLPEGIGLASDPDRARRAGESGDLLAVIDSELPDLAKPIHVFRALPVHAPPETAARTGTLLTLADGTPFLVTSRPVARSDNPADDAVEGRGLVVYLAAPPAFDWTDLQARPLMVPLMQEIVRMGVARAHGSWGAAAGTCPEVPPRTFELRPIGGGKPQPVGIGGRTADPIRVAGLFNAVDERGTIRGIVTVNADPEGGRTDPQAPGPVMAWLAATGAAVEWLRPIGEGPGGHAAALKNAMDRGTDASTWILALLIGAVVFAVLELALARWFSHAQAPAVGLSGRAA